MSRADEQAAKADMPAMNRGENMLHYDVDVWDALIKRYEEIKYRFTMSTSQGRLSLPDKEGTSKMLGNLGNHELTLRKRREQTIGGLPSHLVREHSQVREEDFQGYESSEMECLEYSVDPAAVVICQAACARILYPLGADSAGESISIGSDLMHESAATKRSTGQSVFAESIHETPSPLV